MDVDLDQFGPVEVPAAPETVALYDLDGPRLVISKIVNHNFKSYFGEHILGPFHKSFTCIVGPNGSGKSNVIDSILFVFGFRAQKIRSKKLSVLIHNSKEHPDVQSCRVDVHFVKIRDVEGHEHDFEVLPNTEFVISRSAFRDSSSFYAINGHRANIKEVGQVLRSHGVDLDHNRFLILQGEVEQIALMKPKSPSPQEEGLLEYLEDIIGSVRFIEPLKTLSSRLEQVNGLKLEKTNRVKAIKRELTDLQASKDEAVSYLRLENDICLQKNQLYQKYIVDLLKENSDLQNKLSEMTEELESVNDQFKSSLEKKEKLSATHQDKLIEHNGLTAICEKTTEEFSKLEQEDERLHDEVKHNQESLKKLTKQIEQEKKRFTELEARPAEIADDNERLKQEIPKAQDEKDQFEANLQNILQQMQSKTKPLQQKRSQLESELNEAQLITDRHKHEMDIMQHDLDMLTAGVQEKRNRIEQLKKTILDGEQTFEQKKLSIVKLNELIPQLEQSKQKEQNDVTELSSKERNLLDHLSRLRSQLDDKHSNLESLRAQTKTLQVLWKEKESGRLPGLIGRLGDLGGINPKYDVAISTACGALDNIVCDNIDTCQMAVETLKRTGAGWATFIDLKRQEQLKAQMQRPIETPENVPRLFDLIAFASESVKPAFYFALRDTLVADNLDQATRIAYGRQRWRVVTLQGQLIDISGTMSGGGSRVTKGKMGAKPQVSVEAPRKNASINEGKSVEEMAAEISDLERQLNEIRQCREIKGDKINHLSRELQDNRLMLERMKAALRPLEDKRQMQESQLQQLEKELQSGEQSMSGSGKATELASKLDLLKKEYGEAKKVSERLQLKVTEISDEIEKIIHQQAGPVREKLDAVVRKLDQLVGRQTKNVAILKNNTRDLAKSKQKLDSLEQERADCRTFITQAKDRFAEMDTKAKELMKTNTDAKSNLEDAKKCLQECKEELDRLEHTLKDLKKSQLELEHKREPLQKKVESNEEKSSQFQEQLARLKLHVIDDMSDDEPVTSSQPIDSVQTDSTVLPQFNPDQLLQMIADQIRQVIADLEERLRQINPNMAAIDEFRRKRQIFRERQNELLRVQQIFDEQRSQFDNLSKSRLNEFMAGFTLINNRLKEMFEMLTLGGDAELELQDSLDPFSEGVVFTVRPPRKSWKAISNLSGGEKTLSSLALVFALHHFRPTPFYVMDEIDAALDFKNVSIVASYIKQRTKNAQFIIISLRDNMFELSDRMVGIYKTHNVTKTVCTNVASLESVIARYKNRLKVAKKEPAIERNLQLSAVFTGSSADGVVAPARHVVQIGSTLSESDSVMVSQNVSFSHDSSQLLEDISAIRPSSTLLELEMNAPLVASAQVGARVRPQVSACKRLSLETGDSNVDGLADAGGLKRPKTELPNV